MIDLCGDENYMKHSIFGLMSLYPHYNMLVIDANIDLTSVQEKFYAIP